MCNVDALGAPSDAAQFQLLRHDHVSVEVAAKLMIDLTADYSEDQLGLERLKIERGGRLRVAILGARAEACLETNTEV